MVDPFRSRTNDPELDAGFDLRSRLGRRNADVSVSGAEKRRSEYSEDNGAAKMSKFVDSRAFRS
jgi:hypothetical protein